MYFLLTSYTLIMFLKVLSHSIMRIQSEIFHRESLIVTHESLSLCKECGANATLLTYSFMFAGGYDLFCESE